ncbi:hypothetical protein QJS04_geneDACA012618 [Acorus gramineus]|uniref:Uncharacterized protein n=1 Tax=Acorus gramineus TaxID=55184 RepID=A0AAV9B3M8_ACOGR|nr:hypothetical protein QJS04_geneDACA012618 [Acorus gramineus]
MASPPQTTTASAATSSSAAMLSRDQLLRLFKRFDFLTSQPDVKKRIADAVNDKQNALFIEKCVFIVLVQEAVAVTTAIQEEILLEMGIDPRFGIACLGKVNMVYENDRDLMIQFYKFVSKEELACDEAELAPNEFAEKMHAQHKLQEQQLEMLKHIRKFHPDDQSAILEALRQQLEGANFDNSAAVLTSDKIQEVVRRRITPFIRAT